MHDRGPGLSRSRKATWMWIAGVTSVLGLAVVLWSVRIPTWVDAWWPWPPPPAGAWSGRLMLVWAHTLQPVTAYLSMIVLAVIVGRKGWREQAAALLLTIVFTVSIVTVAKSMVARLRPATDWLGSLHIDASYPSGHAAAGAALAIAIVQVTWTLTRRRAQFIVASCGAALLAAAVAAGRLFLGVHHVSDVLGGMLCAAFAAAIAGVLSGAWHATQPRWQPRTIQVVWNPLRVRSQPALQRKLAAEAAKRGCEAPEWVMTRSGDHAAEIGAAAAAAGVELVIVAGGDGTIRRVLGSVGRAADVAILPVGSANVLALNTGVPLDLSRAMQRALDGPSRPIDVMRVMCDGGEPHTAVVMVGAGADAAVLADTNPRLKAWCGPLAYVWGARGHVEARPACVDIAIDTRHEQREASLVTIGNVGSLRPGLTFLPKAVPDDGYLDVLVASPRSTRDVIAMIVAVLRRRARLPHADSWAGRRIRLDFERPVPFHLDGDSVGSVSSVTVEVEHEAANLV